MERRLATGTAGAGGSNAACSSWSGIIGRSVTCSAVAGWRADQRVIKAKESAEFPLQQRLPSARAPFLPLLGDKVTGTVQIPVTLPALDEVVGSRVDAGASIAICWIVFYR